MALGDKVEELQRIVAIMSERTERVLESLDELYEGQKAIARELSELRREHEKEIALLKREVEDLKQWRAEQKKERDERDRRLWAFGPNVLGALISGLISAVVAYLVARRGS